MGVGMSTVVEEWDRGGRMCLRTIITVLGDVYI